MQPTHGPQPHHARLLRLVLTIGGSLAALSGCTGVQGVHSEGPHTPVAAPRTLWPEHRPLPPDNAPSQRVAVPDAPPVPTGDLRDVDALAVVKADFAAAAGQEGGRGRQQDPRAAAALAACTKGGCPLREPVYHDLTQSGKPELIVAVDIDGRLSELRVYTVDNGIVTRILARKAVIEGVELVAGHLSVREPSSNPAYVSVSDYTWDGTAMSLWELTLDECRPSKGACAPASTEEPR
ncbi:hypothetical protein ACFWP3_36155 [Streptomyces sp. NPDC058525]|uniref:hypothetical protein n=1 Tax=Streptomyces sp. NPDC058525 TaxID=3346538 RepID=UPI0036687C18